MKASTPRIPLRVGTRSGDGWHRVWLQQPGSQRAFQSGRQQLGLSLLVRYQPVHGQQHQRAARLCLRFVLAAELSLADASPLVLIWQG